MKKNLRFGSLKPYVTLNDIACPADLGALFGRTAPLEVEIGFGTGEYLVSLARACPEKDFLGFEQSAERILKTLRKVDDGKLLNVRVMKVDAAWAFRYFLSPGAASAVHCLFPCPWPKKRHAKHRLLSTDFLSLVNSRLADKGVLKVVTDHHPYADWVMERAPLAGFGADRRLIPPTYATKFEKKWLAGGQSAFDEILLTKASAAPDVETKANPMRTYFLDKIDPARVTFTGSQEGATIEFKEYVFDASQKKGMALAIISEEGRVQYLWIMIVQTTKGWCVCPAVGHNVLPTPGVQRAMELAYEAFRSSAAE